MVDDFETRVQQAAEKHLEACYDAADDEEMESPAYGPFDGCTTCVVREVLAVTWDMMLEEARGEVRAERHLQAVPDLPDE